MSLSTRAAEYLGELDRQVTEIGAEDELAFVTHENPDADALASTSLMQFLALHRWQRSAAIYVRGPVPSHLQRFGENIRPLEDLVRSRPPSCLIGVDIHDMHSRHVRGDLPDDGLPGLSAALDHHRVSGPVPSCSWIDEGYAACALQAVELLRVAGAWPALCALPGFSRIATVVVAAIRTDLGYEADALGCPETLADRWVPLFEECLRDADPAILRSMSATSLPGFETHLAQARETLALGEQPELAQLGYAGSFKDEGGRRILPAIADLLLAESTCRLVTIGGVFANCQESEPCLRVCFRSHRGLPDCAVIAQRTVNGGGKPRAAAGRVGLLGDANFDQQAMSLLASFAPKLAIAA